MLYFYRPVPRDGCSFCRKVVASAASARPEPRRIAEKADGSDPGGHIQGAPTDRSTLKRALSFPPKGGFQPEGVGIVQIDFTSPPSMRRAEPVIQRAPADTRKAISSAISSGSP